MPFGQHVHGFPQLGMAHDVTGLMIGLSAYL